MTKTFLSMSLEEKQDLVLQLQKKRELLKEESRMKRAKRSKKRQPAKITFNDPTLQALFDANEEALRKALRK